MDENIKKILDSMNCMYWGKVPLSCFTSLQIGGYADYLVRVVSIKQLESLVRELRLRQIPLCVMGAGQNILVSDAGFRGVVIKNDAREIRLTEFGDDRVLLEVSSGSLFSAVCVTTVFEYGLIGLDWGIYIPGTVGGAIVNNADSFGYDIAQSLYRVQILSADCELDWVESSNLSFGKRESQFCKNRKDIILSAEFILNKAPNDIISERAKDFKRGWRPELPNAGSIFRVPAGQSLAQLIEEVGLKGHRIGDAAISWQHAGWCVNLGKATADEFTRLMMLTVTRVSETRSIRLQPLVKYVGELTQNTIELFGESSLF